MNKFSTWSDQKINEEITRLEYDCGGWGVSPRGKFLFLQDDYEYFAQSIYDYCNNPAAMWPLIDKYKISVRYGFNKRDECVASWRHFERVNAENKNPLRAAAEVYLMMKENLK